MDLGLEIQNTDGRIRISILDIPCAPIFSQNEQLWFFHPILPKNGFRVGKWEK